MSEVVAGLSGTPWALHKYLLNTGIDPDRLSTLLLGQPDYIGQYRTPPLVLIPGEGTELYRGVGIIVLCGIFSSTLLSLTFLPALLMGLLKERSEQPYEQPSEQSEASTITPMK